jgi:hypothetical protein
MAVISRWPIVSSTHRPAKRGSSEYSFVSKRKHGCCGTRRTLRSAVWGIGEGSERRCPRSSAAAALDQPSYDQLLATGGSRRAPSGARFPGAGKSDERRAGEAAENHVLSTGRTSNPAVLKWTRPRVIRSIGWTGAWSVITCRSPTPLASRLDRGANVLGGEPCGAWPIWPLLRSYQTLTVSPLWRS